MREEKTSRVVLSGVAWRVAERGLTRVVTFLVTMVLARLILPAEYGIVSLVMVFITIADVFVASGLPASLVQDKDAADIDFTTLLWCNMTLGIALYALLFLLAGPISRFYMMPELVPVIRVVAFKLPISSLNSVQHAYVQRNLLFRKLFWSSLAGTLLSAVLGIALAFHGFGVWALVAQYLADALVDTIVLGAMVPWKPSLSFSLASAKSHVDYGWKVLASDLSGTIFSQLRSLVVGKLFTPADLALYNKAQQLPSMGVSTLSEVVTSVLFPVMSNASDDVDRVKHYCRRCIQTLSFLCSPVLLWLASSAGPLVFVLFGENWSGCVPYLSILSLGYVFGAIGLIPLQALKAIGRSDVVLRLELYKKPIFLLLLIVGAANSVLALCVTMAVYEVYGTLVNARQLKKYLGYSVREQFMDIVPNVLVSLGCAVATYALPSVDGGLIDLAMRTVMFGLLFLLSAKITHNSSFELIRGTAKEVRVSRAK